VTTLQTTITKVPNFTFHLSLTQNAEQLQSQEGIRLSGLELSTDEVRDTQQILCPTSEASETFEKSTKMFTIAFEIRQYMEQPTEIKKKNNI